jgi:hypothetical protein
MEILHNDPTVSQALWELLDLLVRGLEFQESGGWADEERPTPRPIRRLTPPPFPEKSSFEKAVEILENKDKK